MKSYFSQPKNYVKARIGDVVVGYRFGAAPGSGYSYNRAENRSEPGVSLASVGYLPPVTSFACYGSAAACKKYYYRGRVAGSGSDGEFCITDVEQITYDEYCRELNGNKDYYNRLSLDFIESKLFNRYSEFCFFLNDEQAAAGFGLYGVSVFAKRDETRRAQEVAKWVEKRNSIKPAYEKTREQLVAKLVKN